MLDRRLLRPEMLAGWVEMQVGSVVVYAARRAHRGCAPPASPRPAPTAGRRPSMAGCPHTPCARDGLWRGPASGKIEGNSNSSSKGGARCGRRGDAQSRPWMAGGRKWEQDSADSGWASPLRPRRAAAAQKAPTRTSRDDGQAAALFDVPRGAEEALRLLQGMGVDTAGEHLAGAGDHGVVGPRQTGDGVEQDDHVLLVLDQALGLLDHHLGDLYVTGSRLVEGSSMSSTIRCTSGWL